MSPYALLKFITSHPLNRGQKAKAIARFARWQIGSRLVPGAIVFDWVNGSKLLVRRGDRGLTGNVYTGLHEFPDMAFLLHVLSERDVFVDVGANVGSYTILAGAVAGARGYAFEPVPATYRRLIENIRLNHLENRVTAVNIGIGRAPGVVDFTSDLDTVNHALAPGEPYENAIKVEIATLDTMLAGQHPSLIKIDVEGYESSVLAGASAVLEEPTLNAVIMELNGSGRRYNEDESGILKMMIERGFKSYSYDPFARALTPMNGSNPASGNTLFIRNEAAVLERIAASPFFNVHGKRL